MVPSVKSAVYVVVATVSLLLAAYQPTHPVGARAKSAGDQAAHAVRSTAERLWCVAMSNLAAVNGLHP